MTCVKCKRVIPVSVISFLLEPHEVKEAMFIEHRLFQIKTQSLLVVL